MGVLPVLPAAKTFLSKPPLALAMSKASAWSRAVEANSGRWPARALVDLASLDRLLTRA
jgi:hypothetical protein